jgi:hypothetical protein
MIGHLKKYLSKRINCHFEVSMNGDICAVVYTSDYISPATKKIFWYDGHNYFNRRMVVTNDWYEYGRLTTCDPLLIWIDHHYIPHIFTCRRK